MEHKTGLEDYYVIRGQKKMRFGYTTGSCAAAACKGACLMLLGKEMKIGYIRVSTKEQNTARQEVLLRELGVDEVFIEKASGKKRRPARTYPHDGIRPAR